MIALLLASALAASGPAAALALPPCAPAALSLATDGEGDSFSGMSHQGTLLVVRNIGPSACRIPSLPVVVLRDGAGAELPAHRRAPVGMHPGPVMLPVGLAAGAEATSAILWVSSPVFDHSRCLTPARLSVQLGSALLTTPWPGGQVCGEAGQGALFQQPPLRTDPVLGGG